MFYKRSLLILFSGVLISFSGCTSTRVERVETDELIDLSGVWNDADFRIVSEGLIKGCLEKPWLDQYQKQYGQLPIVIVGTIQNNSHEHINTEVLTRKIEGALINSGKVVFVANKGERGEVRDERQDQNEEGFTSPETQTPMGQETGADFMLKGSVNSVKDELKNKYSILYQVNLELVDLKTNQKVWLGQEEIKKVVTRSRVGL